MELSPHITSQTGALTTAQLVTQPHKAATHPIPIPAHPPITNHLSWLLGLLGLVEKGNHLTSHHYLNTPVFPPPTTYRLIFTHLFYEIYIPPFHLTNDIINDSTSNSLPISFLKPTTKTPLDELNHV